jgi:NAD+ synthase
MIKQDKLQAVVSTIRDWIKEKIQEANCEGAVVGLSGGADSALVAILCQEVVPTHVVKMPCHSSPVSLARADELIAAFPNLIDYTVNLETAFESIKLQTTKKMDVMRNGKMAVAALRSCLRAPTLDFVGKLTNSLIVGTGNRDEDEVTRYFQKRGDGCVDISPIAKLHKSEVWQLLKFSSCPKSIIDAVPSADLWGADSGQEDEKELGLTYEEIEWAIKFGDKTCLFQDTTANWVNGGDLLNLTARQLEVLKKVSHLEKISRHKAEMPPVFNVRGLMSGCFET